MSDRLTKPRQRSSSVPKPRAAYDRKAWGELYLSRLEDAEATVRQARERKIENDNFFLKSYFVALLRGDAATIDRAAADARGRRSLGDMMPHVEPLGQARAGRLQEARRGSAVAVDIAQRSGQLERAALFIAGRALWKAFYGNAAAARQTATEALALARSRDVTYAAAFALVLSGDLARGRTLADDLEKNHPEDTVVLYNYLPALRALFAIDAGDAPAAIQSLQSASRYEGVVRSILVGGPHMGPVHDKDPLGIRESTGSARNGVGFGERKDQIARYRYHGNCRIDAVPVRRHPMSRSCGIDATADPELLDD
jgi:hypothetical protein